MSETRKFKYKNALIALLLFIAGGVVATFWLGPTYEKFNFLYEDFSIDACVDDFDLDESDYRDNPSQARALHAVCYDKIFSQGLLNEYQIRRVNFQNQHVADNIVMWMVVALTFSGVGLAALQIMSSVKIYERNAGETAQDTTEVALEKGKIYLRSSVTGLFILLISFAFFYIYIIYVYTITDIGDREASTNTAVEQIGNVLIEGGLLPEVSDTSETPDG